MRILHTSDWHIGRTFHGVDLLADQGAVLESIAELVAAQSIDVVVVPGDIYDRAVPSADAVLVCNRGLEAIRAAGAVIVGIAIALVALRMPREREPVPGSEVAVEV